MKVLLKIAYRGEAYCGYQVQPNGVTVQQRLNEAAEALFGYLVISLDAAAPTAAFMQMNSALPLPKRDALN